MNFKIHNFLIEIHRGRFLHLYFDFSRIQRLKIEQGQTVSVRRSEVVDKWGQKGTDKYNQTNKKYIDNQTIYSENVPKDSVFTL